MNSTIETLINNGNEFYKAQNYEEAIKCYEKIIQLEPENASVYYYWGNALRELAEIKQDKILFNNTFEKYKEAVRLYETDESANIYKARIFNNWGYAISKLAEINKDENLFQEAFEKYKETVQLYEIDKNKVGKSAVLNNWGNALRKLAEIKQDENLFKEAFKKYDEAVKLEQKDADRAITFNNLGLAFYKLAEIKQDENLFQEAFKKYEKAIELEQQDADKAFIFNNLGIALYSLAEIKQDKNRYEEAVECFRKSDKDTLSIFVTLFRGNKKRIFSPEYFYKLLDDDDFFLKSIEKDETKLNEYKDIYLRSIFIISQLHISNENEKLVAHYSKKEVSQKLILDSDFKFRLNAINHSNDPTEGKTLLDFFYGKSDEKLNTEYEAFASCFTFNFDSLNLFRLYGKENGKEGTGLSLVFKENFFSREAEMSIDSLKADSSEINNDNSIKNEKFSLFRCIYIDPNPKTKQPVVTVGQKEEYLFYREEIEDKFKDYNKEIDRIIENVRKEMKELKELVESKKLNPAIVGKLLLNLRYLVKHIAFKEEQECRIVKIHPLHNNKEIKIEKDYNKMYIEYSLKVSNHIDKIYFGPKAEGFELFKSMLKYEGLDILCEKSENPLA